MVTVLLILQICTQQSPSDTGVGNFFSRRTRLKRKKFFAGPSILENFYFNIKGYVLK